MNSTLKNIITSLIISIIAFAIISFLHPSGPALPASMTEWISLAVILAATLAASFLSRSSPGEASYSGTELGTVKWFNIKKGYGFITRDAGDDIFVHYRNLQVKGRKAISEGQRVQFVVIDGDKGLQADEVETV